MGTWEGDDIQLREGTRRVLKRDLPTKPERRGNGDSHVSESDSCGHWVHLREPRK